MSREKKRQALLVAERAQKVENEKAQAIERKMERVAKDRMMRSKELREQFTGLLQHVAALKENRYAAMLHQAMAAEARDREMEKKLEAKLQERLAEMDAKRRLHHTLEEERYERILARRMEVERQRKAQEDRLLQQETEASSRSVQETMEALESHRRKMEDNMRRRAKMEAEIEQHVRELEQRRQTYEEKVFRIEESKRVHKQEVLDLGRREHKVKQALEDAFASMRMHGKLDSALLQSAAERVLKPAASASRRVESDLSTAAPENRPRRCGLCLNEYPKRALANRATAKSILELRQSWGVASQFNCNHGLRLGTMYDMVPVCHFCAQFLAPQ